MASESSPDYMDSSDIFDGSAAGRPHSPARTAVLGLVVVGGLLAVISALPLSIKGFAIVLPFLGLIAGVATIYLGGRAAEAQHRSVRPWTIGGWAVFAVILIIGYVI